MQKKLQQGKYISVVKGKILDVVVDCRKNSKTFGKHFSCILSEKNSKSIYVPEGFAHGFLSLDKENYVVYSCTKYRDAKSEKSINFKDKLLNIKWPIKKNKILISDKDLLAQSFKEFQKLYVS